MMKTYYMLTKPGIILGNIITMAAGFALASKKGFDPALFFATLTGLGLVISSAGVFNNYLDRVIDAKMSRTKDRPLAKGTIPLDRALIFASILGALGLSTLIAFTNPLTVAMAAFGFFVYLVLYAFMKTRSFYGTLVGSVAGAMPPVIGYTAVSDRLDLGALLLFSLLVLWQMPHFFSIAIYRLEDYAAASIPVLPVEKGIHETKIQTVAYIIAFILASGFLTLFGYTGWIYLLIASSLGLGWLWMSIKGFKSKNDFAWAKQMFRFSLVVIMGICLGMTIEMV